MLLTLHRNCLCWTETTSTRVAAVIKAKRSKWRGKKWRETKEGRRARTVERPSRQLPTRALDASRLATLPHLPLPWSSTSLPDPPPPPTSSLMHALRPRARTRHIPPRTSGTAGQQGAPATPSPMAYDDEQRTRPGQRAARSSARRVEGVPGSDVERQMRR